MQEAHVPGSVGGIPAGVPVAQMDASQLRFLWDQLNRNRDFPSVLKLIEGEREADGEGEHQLLEIYKVMMRRGMNPLRT